MSKIIIPPIVMAIMLITGCSARRDLSPQENCGFYRWIANQRDAGVSESLAMLTAESTVSAKQLSADSRDVDEIYSSAANGEQFYQACMAGTSLGQVIALPAVEAMPQPTDSDRSPENAQTNNASSQDTDRCMSYIGHIIKPISIEAIIKGLSRVPAKKDEYETTKEFNNRVAKAEARISKSYMVSVPVDSSRLAYDADNQLLRVTGDAIGISDLKYPNIESNWCYSTGLTVSSHEREESRYLGANAFGAGVAVARLERVTTVICEHDSVGQSIPVFGNTSLTELKATPRLARSLKKSLKAALLIAPRPPFVQKGYERINGPTIDKPYEINDRYQMLFAGIQCALITDSANKVLAAHPN